MISDYRKIKIDGDGELINADDNNCIYCPMCERTKNCTVNCAWFSMKDSYYFCKMSTIIGRK